MSQRASGPTPEGSRSHWHPPGPHHGAADMAASSIASPRDKGGKEATNRAAPPGAQQASTREHDSRIVPSVPHWSSAVASHRSLVCHGSDVKTSCDSWTGACFSARPSAIGSFFPARISGPAPVRRASASVQPGAPNAERRPHPGDGEAEPCTELSPVRAASAPSLAIPYRALRYR
jgi:hypothetical protein